MRLKELEIQTANCHQDQYPTDGDDYVSYPGYIFNHQTKKKRKYLLPLGPGYTNLCWVTKLGPTPEHVKKAEATYHKVDKWLMERAQRLVNMMFEISGFSGDKVVLYATYKPEPKYVMEIELFVSETGEKTFTCAVCSDSPTPDQQVSAAGEAVLALQDKYWVYSSMRCTFGDVLRRNLDSYLNSTRNSTKHVETLRLQINGRWYQVEWVKGSGKVRISNIPEIII